jgi:hypothetical protein
MSTRDLGPRKTVLTRTRSNLPDRLTDRLTVFFILMKWQNAYGAHKVQTPLPRRYVSAGILMINYNATNVVPTQIDQPLLSSKWRPHFPTHKPCWNEHKFAHVPTGTRNQERVCWRGPAEIYCTRLDLTRNWGEEYTETNKAKWHHKPRFILSK